MDMLEVPEVLTETTIPVLKTNLPESSSIQIDLNKPVCIYNFYNLDCKWMEGVDANRILLLEPSFFAKYPSGDNAIQFVLALSKNIKNIQVVVANFEEALKNIPTDQIHFKEHPTNKHYQGVVHDRDWLFEEITGYYPSFSSYWKKCEPKLKHLLG
jgi:deoxyribodipyrimidine photo-lyase